MSKNALFNNVLLISAIYRMIDICFSMKAMKFVLAVFMLLPLSSKLSAQNGSWGLIAGGNLSTSSESNIGWTAGGQIGALYRYSLAKNWNLQPRLQFAFTESRGKKNTIMEKSVYNQWALSLPVMAEYGMTFGRDWRVGLNAGPYLQYAFFGKYRIPQSSTSGTSFWHSQFGDKFTWGTQVGFLVEWRHLLFSVDYKHSLRSNKNHIASDPGKERNIQLGLGYVF